MKLKLAFVSRRVAKLSQFLKNLSEESKTCWSLTDTPGLAPSPSSAVYLASADEGLCWLAQAVAFHLSAGEELILLAPHRVTD